MPPSFTELPLEAQAAIRAKQNQKKCVKKEQKQDSPPLEIDESAVVPIAAGFASSITQDAYFAACAGLFRHPSIKASLEGVRILLEALAAEEEGEGLAECNYFQFAGSCKEVWDPILNARLAWEGFFVITESESSMPGGAPLPELQPFYGVLFWENFESSKYVKKELAALRRRSGSGGLAGYRLVLTAFRTRILTRIHADFNAESRGFNAVCGCQAGEQPGALGDLEAP